MFSNEDFKNYFSSVEEAVKTIMVESTNFANNLTNRALRSKIDVILQEDLEMLRFIREQKGKFESWARV